MSCLIDKKLLKEQAEMIHIQLEDTALEKFDVYAKMLIEWNEKINLTAIKEPQEIVTKHFVDSLTLNMVLPKTPLRLIDVGTGAGFPGVPITILQPEIKLTLLDSLNKRLNFLKELCDALDIPAVLIHARAEEAGHKPELREKFDIATARAVASLPVLCEYCLPFVKPGGRFIAMKGPDGEIEAIDSKNTVHLLGGEIDHIEKIELQSQEEIMERRLILINKKSTMNNKYPRNSAKIAKQPLK